MGDWVVKCSECFSIHGCSEGGVERACEGCKERWSHCRPNEKNLPEGKRICKDCLTAKSSIVGDNAFARRPTSRPVTRRY